MSSRDDRWEAAALEGLRTRAARHGFLVWAEECEDGFTVRLEDGYGPPIPFVRSARRVAVQAAMRFLEPERSSHRAR